MLNTRRLIALGLTRHQLNSNRTLHQSMALCGRDRRDITAGHLPKSDLTDGEKMPINESRRNSAIELVDENVDNRLYDGIRFSELPVVHVVCTRNNTKVCLRRSDGIVLKLATCGSEGFKNCRKGTTVAAQAAASRIVTAVQDHDIKNLRLVVEGLGPGRNSAVKTFEMARLNVVSITDRTSACEPWVARPKAARSI